MTGTISKFFYNILNYGAFVHKDGVILMWGDPDLLIPPKVFYTLQNKIHETLPDEKFFYFLGHIYGNNASKVLIKKYGFKKEEIDKFTDGGTQDGYGKIDIIQYPNGTDTILVLKGVNAVIAELAKKEKHHEPVDYYLGGMIAGGAQPLYEMDLKMIETKCIAKGDENCEYTIQKSDKKIQSIYLKKAGVDFDKLNEKTLNHFMNRKMVTKFLDRKNIHFGDGTFFLNGVQGVLMPVSSIVLLDIVGTKLLENYQDILIQSFKEHGLNLHTDAKLPIVNIIKNALTTIEVLGLGKYNMKSYSRTKIVISCDNNPLPQEHKAILGISKLPVCSFSKALLSVILTELTKKKVKVTEDECVAQSKRQCTFTATLS